MKQRKNKTAAVAALCLAAVCLMGGVAAAANPGSQTDPLVSLSYLTETVTPSLMQQVDATVAANEKALVDKLNTAIDSYTRQMNAALAQGGGGSGSTYSVVSLSNGQTMRLEIGCEVMLRVGTATCVTPSSPGLIDTTAGSLLNNGGALVKNHLYMATIEGRSIRATAAVKVLVRGAYTIA